MNLIDLTLPLGITINLAVFVGRMWFRMKRLEKHVDYLHGADSWIHDRINRGAAGLDDIDERLEDCRRRIAELQAMRTGPYR